MKAGCFSDAHLQISLWEIYSNSADAHKVFGVDLPTPLCLFFLCVCDHPGEVPRPASPSTRLPVQLLQTAVPPSHRLAVRPSDRPAVRPSVCVAEQQHDCMFSCGTSRSIMEVKERRPYCSLSKSRKDKEGPYAGEAPPALSQSPALLSVRQLIFQCCEDRKKKSFN